MNARYIIPCTLYGMILMSAYSIWLIPPPAFAQSDPTVHVCTQKQADGEEPYKNDIWDQDRKCYVRQWYRYKSYDALNDKYSCTLSEEETYNCQFGGETTPGVSPSPSPSASPTATPTATPASGLSFGEDSRLGLAVKRLTPSGFTTPTSGCRLAFLNAYVGVTKSVDCSGSNPIQQTLSNSSVKFAQALLPPQDFLRSKPPEQQNPLEKLRHWLFNVLVGRAFGIGA